MTSFPAATPGAAGGHVLHSIALHRQLQLQLQLRVEVEVQQTLPAPGIVAGGSTCRSTEIIINHGSQAQIETQVATCGRVLSGTACSDDCSQA